MRLRNGSLALTLALLASVLVSPSYGQNSSFSTLSKEANSARDANQIERAIALYRKALALRPAWPEGWWSLGTLEYDRNHYAQAAQAFRKLVAIDPKNGTGRVMLGLCEFGLGNDDAALTQIEKGKELGISTDPDLRRVVLFHEGVLLQRKGRFESAQDTLDQLCLEGADQSKNLVQTLGMVALRLRSKEIPAGAPAEQVITAVGEGMCLSAQKKFDEARRLFTELANQYPAYPNIHYAFGRFLLDANDTDGAVKQFKQEIQNSPNEVPARLQIAAAEYRVNSSVGIQYAKEAVKLDPQLPFAHFLLGLLLLDTDNYQKAIPELEIAEHAFPKDAKLYFALSSAYARAGRSADAERARAKFLKLNQQGKQQ